MTKTLESLEQDIAGLKAAQALADKAAADREVAHIESDVEIRMALGDAQTLIGQIIGDIPIAHPSITSLGELATRQDHLATRQDHLAKRQDHLATRQGHLQHELSHLRGDLGQLEKIPGLSDATANVMQRIDALTVALEKESKSQQESKRLYAEFKALSNRFSWFERALNEYNDDVSAWQERISTAETHIRETTDRLHKTNEDLQATRSELAFIHSIHKRGLHTINQLSQVNHALKTRLVEHGDDKHSKVREGRFDTLALYFKPKTVVGCSKVRIGAESDGGYVMLDAFDEIGCALSLGIGNDVSWDIDIANKGISVYQFDHSVTHPPSQHELFKFFQRRVDAIKCLGGETLDSILEMVDYNEERPGLILKIDIEESEWQIFATVTADLLSKFDQIVCEFHGFEKGGDKAWVDTAIQAMENLCAQFEIIHIHGNNYIPLCVVEEMPFPSVLEVSFVRRSKYEFREFDQEEDTSLDRPNSDDFPEQWIENLS